MSTKFTDEELVLIAIIQNIPIPVSPEKIEEKAMNLSNSDDVIYDGPKPEYNTGDTFDKAWNQLITKNYIRHVDSKDNVPLFVDNTDIRALNEICDSFIEKQSFLAVIRS